MSKPKRSRRQRGSISVDQILTGAFEVAEMVAVDNVSMPLLARHLGVGVTSIYWYFRRKDDLLDAMTARAIADVGIEAPPIDAADWRGSLERHARTVRASFREHPILCDLLLIRKTYEGTVGRAALRAMEQAVHALVQAGLAPGDAFEVYTTVAMHTRGSVILQRIQEKSDYAHAHPGDNVVDPETMPLIAASHRGKRIGIADDSTFDYVLECILDRAALLLGAREQVAG